MAARPELFDAYHEGFAAQTRGWPVQPVDAAIAFVTARLPPAAVVADFGCGDARLAASVRQVGVCVFCVRAWFVLLLFVFVS